MRDRNLERNISRIEDFVEQWKRLSQFLDRGFKGENFSGEEEGLFLELKSKIAQEYELLMTTLGPDGDRDDRTMRLLNGVSSLHAFKEMPEGTAKKIANEWHGSYMAMQSLLGKLKGRQAQLESVSTLRLGLRNVISNPMLIVIVMLAASYGIYKFADEWIPKIKQLMESKP